MRYQISCLPRPPPPPMSTSTPTATTETPTFWCVKQQATASHFNSNRTMPIVNRSVDASYWRHLNCVQQHCGLGIQSGNFQYYHHQINYDADPIIIRKRPRNHIEYIQELTVRYLKPPTPPPPGEIVIQGMFFI